MNLVLTSHQEAKAKSSTVLRTFRIPRNLIATLEAEGKNRGLSANALMTSLISRFDNWDRFADRFDFFSITDDLIKAFLEEVPEDRVVAIAETFGARIARDGIMFWSKEVSVESLVEYLNNRCRYAGYGNLQYEKKDQKHTLILQHSLGLKWSIFIQHTLDQVLKKPLGITAQFETTESSIVARFTT